MTATDQVEHMRFVAKEELSRSHNLLEDSGLTWSEPEFVVSVRSADKYTAELKTQFYKDGELVDIFEFFVCRDGALVISEEYELRQWIRDNVPDVVRHRRHI
jgi:hypothetical protein